jgi:hypothetical protein
MKTSFIILFLVLSSHFSVCQHNTGIFSINVGVHRTDAYQKPFYYYFCTEGCYPTQQTSADLFDFNVLYTRQTKIPKLNIIIGIGLNQKGLNGYGMHSNGAVFHPGEYNFKDTYVGFYGGIGYNFLTSNKTKFTLGQLFNPEIPLGGYDYKTIVLATRTHLTFSYKISGKSSILLTPYFQTALARYNRTKLTYPSSDYIPFSYGLNLGISL